MSILRTWTKTEKAVLENPNPWKIWDRGDEIWELRNDILRHFSVVERTLNGEIIREELRELKESPIPLEALEQEIQGWEITEQAQDQAQAQVQDEAPHTQQPLVENIKKNTKKAKNTQISKVRPPQSSLTQSSHERQTPVIPSSQEEEQQQNDTLPAELWSSLSQWIPPNALFQPSLHHQAFLELSGTQGLSYPSQRDSEKHSQRWQGQRQHVKQSQGSKPYRQATSAQKTRVSAGPLFV